MNYIVLARKWRPKTFSEVIGQQHIITTLCNSLALKRLHHAYLFSGTHGIGKTSIARLLAKCFNCETGITATPCAQCNSCREFEQARFVDFIEIDAASRTKVEDTRDLLDNMQYTPTYGRFKVYLIDEVHMLSRQSFNALLKTIEEPPTHVKLLLVTTDSHKLPITVRSRCMHLHLHVLNTKQIHLQLKYILRQEKIEFDDQALYLLARASNGSMRDALSLTDQAIVMGQGSVLYVTVLQMLGILDDEQALALIEALANGQGEQMMLLLDQAALKGVEWETLLIEILRLLHCIAMVQFLPRYLEDHDIKYTDRLHTLARFLPTTDVQLYYQTILMGRKDLSLAPTRRLGVEMTLLRALAFHPKPKIAQPILSSELTSKLELQLNESKSIILEKSYVDSPDNRILIKKDDAKLSNLTDNLPKSTKELLEARTQLLKQTNKKKDKLIINSILPIDLKRLENPCSTIINDSKTKIQINSEQLGSVEDTKVIPNYSLTIPDDEKKFELSKNIVQEVKQRDPWATEIVKLNLPKLIQQLLLNAWKETAENKIILHLRSHKQYLNTENTCQIIQNALRKKTDNQFLECNIIQDDDLTVLTPMELYHMLYEEKLAIARQSIENDTHIQTLRKFFDADLDQNSVRPL
ncbi:DNA polymerase III subunit gamma/tau [Candidatus Pantoea carbekii]|uniref:DNA polymerase III subunit gamma/tau n=1 Tax=Candidatus Pantoea carbekii TaxID=1235990 RepID=UPI0005C5898E|nr:DNA polymerase III subunit gamma/tau [Candidatus Pantoea carbekii]